MRLKTLEEPGFVTAGMRLEEHFEEKWNNE